MNRRSVTMITAAALLLVPQPTMWLRPHLMAPHTAVMEPHSPGFFCPGEWF